MLKAKFVVPSKAPNNTPNCVYVPFNASTMIELHYVWSNLCKVVKIKFLKSCNWETWSANHKSLALTRNLAFCNTILSGCNEFVNCFNTEITALGKEIKKGSRNYGGMAFKKKGHH